MKSRYFPVRVVKSFANEEIENEKFKKGNDGFLDAKKNSYRYMGGYNAGLTAFTTAITVVVMLSGGVMIARGKGNITDLITFLLYINVFTEPIKTLIDFRSSSRMAIPVLNVLWK